MYVLIYLRLTHFPQLTVQLIWLKNNIGITGLLQKRKKTNIKQAIFSWNLNEVVLYKISAEAF